MKYSNVAEEKKLIAPEKKIILVDIILFCL